MFLGLAANDLAVQVLQEQPLRPLVGSCRRCGHRRGWTRRTCPRCGLTLGRELVVVASTAIAATGFGITVGASWLLLPFTAFLLLTAALGVTDIEAMRIVDRLNLRGSVVAVALLGLAATLEGSLPGFWRGILGGGAYFAGALVLFVIARGNGFGAGDVKLAPVLGVFTTYFGWPILGRAVFGTAVIGGILAVWALLFSEAKRDTELPYGPAMILGAWIAIASVGISAI